MDQGLLHTPFIELFLVENPAFLDEFVKVHVTKERICGWLQTKLMQNGASNDPLTGVIAISQLTLNKGLLPTDISTSIDTVVDVCKESALSAPDKTSNDGNETEFLNTETEDKSDDVTDKDHTNRKSVITGEQEGDAETGSSKRYICDTCSKAFMCKQHLTRHLILHTGEKPFKCRECGRGFTQSTHLKSHLLIHSGDLPYPCTICGKAFRTSSNMQKHVRFYHQEENRRRNFKCEICGKAFIWSSNLQRHLNMHSDNKPYICNICGIRYGRPDQLKEHLRLHNPETMFSCDKCDKKFTTKSYLRRHLVTHSEERPFECESCHKMFKHSAHLKKHHARHIQESKKGRHKGRPKKKQTKNKGKVGEENLLNENGLILEKFLKPLQEEGCSI